MSAAPGVEIPTPYPADTPAERPLPLPLDAAELEMQECEEAHDLFAEALVMVTSAQRDDVSHASALYLAIPI